MTKQNYTKRRSLNKLTFEGIKINKGDISQCFKHLIDYAIETNQINMLPEQLKLIIPAIKNYHELNNEQTNYLEESISML